VLLHHILENLHCPLTPTSGTAATNQWEGKNVRLAPRKRLFVDSKVQGMLLVRVVAYWCFYALAITELLLCWDIATGPRGPFFSHFRFIQLWQEHGTVMIASLFVLPIMLIDVLYVSNRFVGPVYRLRRSLRSLAAGEHVAPVQFRKGDYGLEMADEINAVVAYVEELKRRAHVADDSPVATVEIEHEPVGSR
jgi:hypothetical protein